MITVPSNKYPTMVAVPPDAPRFTVNITWDIQGHPTPQHFQKIEQVTQQQLTLMERANPTSKGVERTCTFLASELIAQSNSCDLQILFTTLSFEQQLEGAGSLQPVKCKGRQFAVQCGMCGKIWVNGRVDLVRDHLWVYFFEGARRIAKQQNPPILLPPFTEAFRNGVRVFFPEFSKNAS